MQLWKANIEDDESSMEFIGLVDGIESVTGFSEAQEESYRVTILDLPSDNGAAEE